MAHAGLVVKWVDHKHFGFIRPHEQALCRGSDIFAHVDGFGSSRHGDRLVTGRSVRFDVRYRSGRPCAVNVSGDGVIKQDDQRSPADAARQALPPPAAQAAGAQPSPPPSPVQAARMPPSPPPTEQQQQQPQSQVPFLPLWRQPQRPPTPPLQQSPVPRLPAAASAPGSPVQQQQQQQPAAVPWLWDPPPSAAAGGWCSSPVGSRGPAAAGGVCSSPTGSHGPAGGLCSSPMGSRGPASKAGSRCGSSSSSEFVWGNGSASFASADDEPPAAEQRAAARLYPWESPRSAGAAAAAGPPASGAASAAGPPAAGAASAAGPPAAAAAAMPAFPPRRHPADNKPILHSKGFWRKAWDGIVYNQNEFRVFYGLPPTPEGLPTEWFEAERWRRAPDHLIVEGCERYPRLNGVYERMLIRQNGWNVWRGARGADGTYTGYVYSTVPHIPGYTSGPWAIALSKQERREDKHVVRALMEPHEGAWPHEGPARSGFGWRWQEMDQSGEERKWVTNERIRISPHWYPHHLSEVPTPELDEIIPIGGLAAAAVAFVLHLDARLQPYVRTVIDPLLLPEPTPARDSPRSRCYTLHSLFQERGIKQEWIGRLRRELPQLYPLNSTTLSITNLVRDAWFAALRSRNDGHLQAVAEAISVPIDWQCWHKMLELASTQVDVVRPAGSDAAPAAAAAAASAAADAQPEVSVDFAKRATVLLYESQIRVDGRGMRHDHFAEVYRTLRLGMALERMEALSNARSGEQVYSGIMRARNEHDGFLTLECLFSEVRNRWCKKMCAKVYAPDNGPVCYGEVINVQWSSYEQDVPPGKLIKLKLAAPPDAFWACFVDREKPFLSSKPTREFTCGLQYVDEGEATHTAQCEALRIMLCPRQYKDHGYELEIDTLCPFVYPDPAGGVPTDRDNVVRRSLSGMAPNDAWKREVRDKLGPVRLFPAQRQALENCMTKRVSLVQGPPGTGKTFMAAAIAKAWSVAYPGERVLCCADSNAAADNLCRAMQTWGVRYQRVGCSAGKAISEMVIAEDNKDFLDLHARWTAAAKEGNRSLEEKLRRCIEQKSLGDSKCTAIVSTCTGSYHKTLRSLKFERVIIDEATQSTQPSSLIPLTRGAEQLVLIGDHKQLPPTILNQEAAGTPYCESLFERIQRLRPGWCVMLDVQRRMHPSISEFPNAEFYGGLLQDHECTYDVAAHPGGFTWPCSRRVAVVDTSRMADASTRAEAPRGTSFVNEKEVQVVGELLRWTILNEEWGHVRDRGHSVGVITPYAAQRREFLRHGFWRRYVPGGLRNNADGSLVCDASPRLDTIDGFQGSEREIIIISLTRSNPHGTLGFICDERRMNVMLTRAKRGLIVVGDTECMKKTDDPHWRHWLQQMEGYGAITTLDVMTRSARLPPPDASCGPGPSGETAGAELRRWIQADQRARSIAKTVGTAFRQGTADDMRPANAGSVSGKGSQSSKGAEKGKGKGATPQDGKGAEQGKGPGPLPQVGKGNQPQGKGGSCKGSSKGSAGKGDGGKGGGKGAAGGKGKGGSEAQRRSGSRGPSPEPDSW
eukprot:TRINITY_DN17392_c1_g1_i1.p1 TRINITY_DN17392_c1_g1~~TRINITY_DN17392_c1_g1_i1.p1  ORF type:complete len:1577 (+),score=346.46 TRINITY_DN17392_c1_g1_i1:97-4731(+)